MGYIIYNLYKHRELLYGTKMYAREIPGTTLTKVNGHMGKLECKLKISSFVRGPPIK